jgi:hypothetical protein
MPVPLSGSPQEVKRLLEELTGQVLDERGAHARAR